MQATASPSFTFTVPSLQGDTDLECRIYHPSAISAVCFSSRGAVIAHPYAGLGGCYDDPNVLSLVDQLLEESFVVGTFNFRGAASSKARTSWTAKAETMDFVSFTGLLVCYLFSLESMQANKSPTLSPHPIRILLGGYSYGAMITTLLPPISSILPYFTSPQPGSPAAEIRFRAAHLARTHLHTLSTSRGRSPGKLQPPSSPIVFGGHEPGSFSPTPSSRRSLDSSRIRQSIERSRQKLHLSTEKAEYQHTSSETPGSATATEEQLQTLDIQTPKTAYLLISPILGAVAGLATLFSASSARSSGEEKLLSNDTMVVYGDEDAFTSVHKLRRWCEELKGRSEKAGEATFRYCEVGGAGHFWREIDVEKKMRETVRQWIRNAVIK